MKKPVSLIPADKRTGETLWRLVDARCTQLTDAVAAARIPFLLGLTWSFMWIAAIYFFGFGYTQTYLARYKNYLALAADASSPNKDRFEEFCLQRTFGGKQTFSFAGNTNQYDKNWQLKYCKEAAKYRHEFAEKAYLESTMVPLPAGLGRLHISDFGIMGNAAILLILLWSFYATRRENHAIKTFVDFGRNKRAIYGGGSGFCIPAAYRLEPQDPNLSAEHYAFSYHAVSQRFLFLFSSHARPLLAVTAAMCSIPAMASLINFLTDAFDLWSQSDLFEPSVYARFAVETALFLVVLLVTWNKLCLMIETSVLLNGWYLAVSDVWMKEWDESTADPASAVWIDAIAQTAEANSNGQEAE